MHSDTTIATESEVPPISKKLSVAPTFSRFSALAK